MCWLSSDVQPVYVTSSKSNRVIHPNLDCRLQGFVVEGMHLQVGFEGDFAQLEDILYSQMTFPETGEMFMVI